MCAAWGSLCTCTSCPLLHPDMISTSLHSNDFSRAVAQEYLSFFQFSGQSLDQALR